MDLNRVGWCIRILRTGVVAAAICALVDPAPAQEPTAEHLQFQAGAATSNITPWLGVSIAGHMSDRVARHIHDELHVRCLVLDDGNTKLAFAIVDSCMVPREIVLDSKQQIEQHVGIPADHVLIAATHTHSAPAATSVFQSDPDPDYQRFLASRIVDGVRRAANLLRPARIAWASGSVPDQVFNRRWKLKPEIALTNPFGGPDKVQMNPPRASENLLEPAGPTDPEVPFIYVVGQDDAPIALLANYSLHYVGGDGPGHVSADYFGFFADGVAEILGVQKSDPPFVAMLTNGTSGNINNINFRVPPVEQYTHDGKPYRQMKFVADRVAREIQSTIEKGLQWHDSITLRATAKDLDLGVRKPTDDEVTAAKEIIAKAGGSEMKTLPEIYARETALIAGYPDRVPVTLQAIRIGDLAITAIPCEVFVEIGLDLKRTSPLKPTFTIELANGYNGYLPTPEHHALGGYETWRARSSYLETSASEKIVATLSELLDSLAAGG
ncbi:MAG: hypothetical protein AMXMBFR4_27000 [Candidatus Hydrogenedentota bacterium]